MRTFSSIVGSFALTFGLGFTTAASAAPIVTLFNTGVATNNVNGTPATVVADGVADPHYTVLSTPATSTPFPAVVVDQTPYPFSVWQADDSSSKWISIQGDESSIYEPVGNYVYQTTFSLAGLDPSTASITGTYYDDDAMVDMVLNSFDTGINDASTNVMGGQPFSITQGFVAGLNTLTITVANDEIPASVNPTGLRLVMTGTAAVLPEPASICFLAIGGMLALGRRRATGRAA